VTLRRRFFVAVLVLALAITLTVAVTSFAAPGGVKAGLRFNPNPVAAGTQHHVNGWGFRPNTWVTVGEHYSGVTWWTSFVTNDTGTFDFMADAREAGSIYVEAKEMTSNGSLRVKATAWLTVVDGV